MKQFSNLKRAFLPCLFVLLTLPAWGQMQPVTKNFRKTPLKNVLKEVEAQTGLSIMYDTRELNLERPVTASFDRTPCRRCCARCSTAPSSIRSRTR